MQWEIKIPRKVFRLLEHTEGSGMRKTIKVTYMEMEISKMARKHAAKVEYGKNIL